ncbi:MAG: Ig-like domain-containing protein [Deltaproteobacteria bacterium]|nr:Ig-like domain-containing protein [Deltaproteobacteria bacterium]
MYPKVFTLALFITMTALACDTSGPVATDGGIDTAAADSDVQAQDIVFDKGQPDESPQDVAEDESSKDIHFKDLIADDTPPKVVKTEPADEATGVAVPFTIKVTFSEGIRFKETVDKNTFMVQDLNGKEVPGTYTYDEDAFTVTFTPDPAAKLMLASPYRVTLKSIIQDKAGNGLEDWFYFGFSTTLPPDLAGYKDLAAKYSPIIYQSTKTDAPHFDYLTSFDFDGNWKANDNYNSIKKATEVKSWVYYDVTETKSHYFIRYAFFWPLRFGVAGGTDAFGNDVSGATVVVAKYPTERPIAVETYFLSGSNEEVRSYVTDESGIVDDKGNAYYGVNWTFPQATLFPAGHYIAYLTAQTHESCLWNHTVSEGLLDQRCQINDGIKSTLTTVRYAYESGNPTAIKKGEKGFPATLDGVDYGLKSVMGEWWVRRDHVSEDGIFTNTYDYEAPEGRMGNGMEIPSAFVDPVDPASANKGRPPWAWKWAAATIDLNFFVYKMPRGTVFLDPAYFFAKRHRLSTLWNPTTKMGFSTDYCYNQYLLVDQRKLDPECN